MIYTVRIASLPDDRHLLMQYEPGKPAEVCVVSLSKLVWPANTQSIVKKLRGDSYRTYNWEGVCAFFPVDKCLEKLQECGPNSALAKKQFRAFLADVWPLVLALPERLMRHVSTRDVRASIRALKELVNTTPAAWKDARPGVTEHLDALESAIGAEPDETPIVY